MDRLWLPRVGWIVLGLLLFTGLALSLPSLFALHVEYERQQAVAAMQETFPVTVNPQEKVIIEDPLVDAYLESPHSPLAASVGGATEIAGSIFSALTVAIAESSWYQGLASPEGRFVNIAPGMRKEQVASAFGKSLGWNAVQIKEFLKTTAYSSLPFSEGSFAPGTYVVTKGTTPIMAQALVNERFAQNYLARYSTTTAQVVPLMQALTIASLIEREAGGKDDMRLISGIIWNRIFINMNLQIDATLQYAKANALSNGNWWPVPVPADRFRKSPYNTYLNRGLPPTPIASPSVAAVVAALNPKKTPCLFYFHDSLGGFHCSENYEGHVTLLKKYYGRGK